MILVSALRLRVAGTEAARKRGERRQRVSGQLLNIRVGTALCDNGRLEVSENAISSARTKFAGWTLLGIRHWRS